MKNNRPQDVLNKTFSKLDELIDEVQCKKSHSSRLNGHYAPKSEKKTTSTSKKSRNHKGCISEAP